MGCTDPRRSREWFPSRGARGRAGAATPEASGIVYDPAVPSEAERLQADLAVAHGEVRQLRETIGELRDELERGRIGEEERAQRAVAAAHEEAAQLKATISTLRDELELQRLRHEEDAQRIEKAWHGEAAQLHETINALRGRLEELA